MARCGPGAEFGMYGYTVLDSAFATGQPPGRLIVREGADRPRTDFARRSSKLKTNETILWQKTITFTGDKQTSHSNSIYFIII
jgi:hypothetical protein